LNRSAQSAVATRPDRVDPQAEAMSDAASLAAFDREMDHSGIVHFPAVLDAEASAALKADSERVIALRRSVQARNGVEQGMEGIGHHMLGEGTSLDTFVAAPPLWDAIERYFNGKFILLNFGATLNLPGRAAYTLKPHRDVRAWTRDYRLSLNMLVMLDDFTAENGATLFLAGSHRIEQPPTLEAFQARALQRTGRAGDILLFNSLVVHAASPNRSAAPRAALTLCFGRPFMKPQMDWPRFLGPGAEARLTPRARQLLGYDARVAASLEEYYQPPERWTFKADQR
jgi:ectoine hydroxylase-related dioxygenase (phytanoyl-CoA dioxygenase family)